MDTPHHAHHRPHAHPAQGAPPSPALPQHRAGHSVEALDRTAWLATLHCLSGCAIGEVAGLALGTAFGLGNGVTIALATALAFVSGFGLTAWPLLRSGVAPRAALRIALAADSASIVIMELVDNASMLAIPGAMNATLDAPRSWLSMAASLALAGVAAFPVNRWLIARGAGHAVAHRHHSHGRGPDST